MSKQTEDEFLADFEAGMARMVARECYRAIHPGGMHTNGPTLVNIEVSRLLYVLSRWKKQPNQEPTAEGALKDLRQRLGMETPAAPEPPEKTWDCVCGRSNYVTWTRCYHCGFQRATANR